MDLSFSRLLTLLEMLQVYRQLNAADIAERLEVSPRTVRRYITGLQDMGIPVEADRGPAGGYRLRRGFKLPPLMLTNDEALVMVIGLLAAQRLGLSASGPAIQGALAKLDRLLPETQRAQVQSMQDFVSLGLEPVSRDHANAETILAMTSAARDATSIHLGYRSAAGDVTQRVVDPYGVAFQSGHWYVVTWDHFRNAIRTFRLDRVLTMEPTNETFQRPERFDVIEHIQRAIRELQYNIRCEVLLDLPLVRHSRACRRQMGASNPPRAGHCCVLVPTTSSGQCRTSFVSNAISSCCSRASFGPSCARWPLVFARRRVGRSAWRASSPSLDR